jgi:hypothetical protein
MTDLIRYTIGGSAPYCEKCKRTVDFWSVEYKYGLDVIPAWMFGYPQYEYNGRDQITLHVECHGEVFRETYFGEVPK